MLRTIRCPLLEQKKCPVYKEAPVSLPERERLGRASLLEEKRKMLFEDVYSVWKERRLTQEEAAQTAGGLPADVPALVDPLRGGRDRWSAGPSPAGGVAPAPHESTRRCKPSSSGRVGHCCRRPQRASPVAFSDSMVIACTKSNVNNGGCQRVTRCQWTTTLDECIAETRPKMVIR